MTSWYLIIKILDCLPILLELASCYSIGEIKEKTTKKSRAVITQSVAGWKRESPSFYLVKAFAFCW